MKHKYTLLLSSLAVVLAGLLSSVHAANIATNNVTVTLWPGGAPYTFFDTASLGDQDTTATSINFDRSFGILNVGGSGSQIIIRGMGWASVSSLFTATNVMGTFTYLGADGTNGGGDDVIIGMVTNNVTPNTVNSEWAWVFDNPITNTIDGVSNRFRITLSRVGTGNMQFKGIGAGNWAGVKLSVAGSSTALGAGDPLARKWVGGVDGNWDTTTTNWSDGVASETYVDGKNVTFDDTLSISPLNNNITLDNTYSPSNIVANNTAYSYSLSGGGLTGNMNLTKNGTNVFSLSMSNSYTGLTTVNAGKLLITHANALGSHLSNVVVATGATLVLSNGITLSDKPLTLNGNGTPSSYGALNSIDPVNPVTVAGPITLGSNAKISTFANTAFLNINSPITDKGSNYTLALQIAGSGATLSTISLNSASNTLGKLDLYGYQTTYGQILFGTNHVAPAALLGVGGGLFDLNGTSQQFAGITNGADTATGRITNSSATLSTLTIDYSGTGSAQVLSVPISGNINLVKNGTGTQNFGGGVGVAHSYTGTTTINGGVLSIASDLSNVTNTFTVNNGGILRGITTYGGALTVNPGGTFYAGYASNALGTVTVNNNLTLAGDTIVALNKDVSPSSDVINVTGALQYGGTLTIYNIGASAMATGDSFTVFSPGGTGSFTILGDAGPGLKYQFNDGVINVVNATATYPTNINYEVSGSTMTVSWPETHLGWYAQSNSVSLSSAADWHDIPGSESGTNAVITIDPAEPKVFYRLSDTSQP